MPRDDATDEGKVQVVGKICESPASAQKMPNPVSRVLQNVAIQGRFVSNTEN